VAIKYSRKGLGIFDNELRVLNPRTCFERITSDGTNAIYLLLSWEVETGNHVTLAPDNEQANDGRQSQKRNRGTE
jgi:hypothetical protein